MGAVWSWTGEKDPWSYGDDDDDDDDDDAGEHHPF